MAVPVLLLAVLPVSGIETDQFYAWGRTIRDSTDVLNAHVNAGIEDALEEINAGAGRDPGACEDVVDRGASGFRFLLFWKAELWAINTSLVDRVPSSPEEELRYREEYLYAFASPLDAVRRMPPSPTIEAAGVRFGTDKLTHFLSEGYLQHGWRRSYVRKGLPPDEAERRAIRKGMLVERTVLGTTSSGVFSPADLEANHAGMRFYDRLCDEASPGLRKTDGGWRLDRPLDLREFVTPEWDESWQPNVFTERRWRRLLPALRAYCPLLDDPEVRARREAYRARDSETPTERALADLARRGKLPDPAAFSIEKVCENRGRQPNSGPGPDPDGSPERNRSLSPD
mgnify:FL=1